MNSASHLPRIFFLLAAVFAFLTLSAAGQESKAEREKDLRSSAATVREIINKIRPHLFGGLTGKEATIYNKITFRVTERDTLSEAGSMIEDGTRIVEIDEGYGRQIEMMGEAMLIENELKRPILVPYTRYVVSEWNGKATFVKDPSGFAHFNFDRILDDPNKSEQWSKLTTNALAFVIAHEVGHHVLGHVDKPYPKDLTQRRQMEMDADAWAIECLENAHPHFSPISGLLPLIFDYYVTEKPIEHESQSDHPADSRRLEAMFQAMEDSLPDYRDDIEKEGERLGFTYKQYREFIEGQIENYEKQIESDSNPTDQESTEETRPAPRQSTENMRPAPQPRRGAYCGDIWGNRVCAMAVLGEIGTACGCPYVPGYGVVVP